MPSNTTTKSEWRRVNKSALCPVCRKPDACKITVDGAIAMCKRIDHGSFKQSNGWFFHRLKEQGSNGYNGNGNGHAAQQQQQAAKPAAEKAKYPTIEAAIEGARYGVERQSEQAATFGGAWTYTKDGAEVMRVIRFNLADGSKQFRPMHPAKGGYKMGDPAGLLPLYRVDELADKPLVVIVEGEKAADAAWRLGFPATTGAHGSAGHDKTDWSPLAGKHAVILPDADEPGKAYALGVAKILARLESPAKVKIVDLPGLAVGGDIVDFIAAGGTAEQIAELEEKAAWIESSDLIGGPVIQCLADVESKRVEWLWPGRIPAGRITLFVGMPGVGKSFVTTDMASRVSTGSPWPDGRPCPRGSVILICAEDDAGDTIRPRLDAHSADVRRIHLLTMVRHIADDGKRSDTLFTLADVRALEAALQRIPDCRLIVIDPIGSYLGGGTDAHRDNEVRAVLAPVARLAEKYGPAMLVVAHRRKGGGNIADDLALGSRAFTGIARCVWHLSRDTEDKSRRLFLPGKNNLAPEGDGLGFTIEGDPAAICWEKDPVTMNADEGLAAENGADGMGGQSGEAAEWLRSILEDLQEHPVKDLKAAAENTEFSWRSLERAAKRLKVISHRGTFGGGCIWRLPKPAILANTRQGVASGEYGEYGEYANGEYVEGGEYGEYVELPRKEEDSKGENNHTRQEIELGGNGENGGELTSKEGGIW